MNNTAVYDIERRNWKTELPSWAFGSAIVINEEFPNQLYVSFRNGFYRGSLRRKSEGETERLGGADSALRTRIIRFQLSGREFETFSK